MKYLIHALSNLLTVTLIFAALVWNSVAAVMWLKFFTIFGLIVIPLSLVLLLAMLFVDEQKVAAECKKNQMNGWWYGLSTVLSIATVAFYVTNGFIGYAAAHVGVLLLAAVARIVHGVLASRYKKPIDQLSEKELKIVLDAINSR